MPIDVSQVQWDAIDPNQVQWDSTGNSATEIQKVRASVPGRFVQGIADPALGVMQLISKIPGADPMVQLRKSTEQNLRFKGIDPSTVTLPKSFDEQVRSIESSYQEARKATGSTGFDGARLTGNLLSPVNLAAASRVPQAASLLGKAGYSAATGGGFGLMQPVTEGDYWTEKGKQVATGTAAGGILPFFLGGLSRMIRPNTRPEVKKLLEEGVTPAPGQILGGRWQVLEDKLTSLPIVGDAISSARKKSLDEFNRAVYKRALSPIDGEAPKEIGREGVREVREQLGKAYDELLPKISFKADQQFASELNQLRSLVSQLPEQQVKQFEKVLQTQLSGKMTPQGLMNGTRLKEVESELGRLAKGYLGDSSFDNRQLGSAISQLQNLIRENLVRSNPQFAEKLAKINKGYANYTRIRDAASRQGSADGKFTPAQLSAAVRSGDKTVGKRAFSEGNALLQDLSDAGKDVLGSKYPDSGSIGRLALGAGAVGGGYVLNPMTLAGAGLATLPYLPGGRQLAAGLLARRPEIAGLIAQQVRQSAPFLTAPAGLLAGQLAE